MPKRIFISLILIMSFSLVFGGLFYLLPTGEVYADEVLRWHCYAWESGCCVVENFECGLGNRFAEDQTGNYDHICFGCQCPETGYEIGVHLRSLPIDADAACNASYGTTIGGTVVCPSGIWEACDIHNMIYTCYDCGATCNSGCSGVCCDNMAVDNPGGSVEDHDSFTCQDCIPGVCCQDHNVWGWAWSENIGWISFSCKNCSEDPRPAGCPAGDIADYGVDIDADGNLLGHAWSENIGWISFNATDLVGCPEGACEAKVNTSTMEVSGWARALAYGDGWDGWIKLREDASGYGVWVDTSVSPAEFRDWAWGGDDVAEEAVVGWTSFNHENCDTDGDGSSDGAGACPLAGTPISDYKVMTDLSIQYILNVSSTDGGWVDEPGEGTPVGIYPAGEAVNLVATASTSYQFVEWTGDVSTIDSTSSATTFITMNGNYSITANFAAAIPPTADMHCVPVGCTVYENDAPIVMHNDSTDPDGDDDIIKSEWDIIGIGGSPNQENSGPGNLDALFTPQTYMPNTTGTYTVQLTVYDAASLSDSTSTNITIKEDAKADFECSLTGNPGDWHSDCGDVEPVMGDTVYFRDDLSHASEGAFISTWDWTFENGNPAISSISNPTTTFQSGGEKDVTLYIEDSAGRNDDITKTLNVALPLPEYREVPPISRLDNFLSRLSNILSRL